MNAGTDASDLVSEHKPYAIHLARKLCLAFEGLDGDAVESDAMLGLLLAAQRFDASRNKRFGPFARTIIFREIYAGLRRESRQRILLGELIESGEDRFFSESPDAICSRREEAEFVRENVSPARYARAGSPRLSAKSLARELKISQSAAALRVRKARQLLSQEGLS